MPEDASAGDPPPLQALRAFGRLRVVELGTWIAAPVATALLADLGADVVKVEPPAGDPGRGWFKAMGVADGEVQPTFALDNRHKRSVVLELGTAEGITTLHDLLAGADVLVTNMRVPTLRRLGLDPDHVLARYPRLVYGSITAFGLEGPDAGTPGYDVGAFWARSGLSHQLGGVSPLHAPGAYGDHITGLSMFAAIVAGLYERQTTGRGGLVETSLLQTGSWIAGPDLSVHSVVGRVKSVPPRADAQTPLVNSYRSADGHWFFLTCIETMRHFAGLCKAIDRPELVTDPRFGSARSVRRHRHDLISLLDEAFAGATMAEWRERFAANDVWWQPVQAPPDVLRDPQIAANGWLEDVQVSDGRTVPMLTSPIRVFGTRRESPARAPFVGEHGGVRGPAPRSED